MNTDIKVLSKFIELINEKYPIKFAYLFGSRARGEERVDSDIDLALFFTESYEGLEEVLIRGDIIEDGKAFFKIPTDIVSLNVAPILLKYQVVKDGIIIKDSEDIATFESLVLREYFDFKYYSDIYNEAMIKSIKQGNYFGRN